VREQHWRDVEVILDEVAFGDAQLRPEKLVEIGELHYLIPDLNVEVVLVFGKFDLRD
jgi:hypothetical protein